MQSGPDDSADDLNFFLIPVVRPISGLPNGSPDGGCKIPPGPGQNPLKFSPQLTPLWLKLRDSVFGETPRRNQERASSIAGRKKIKIARHIVID